MRRSFSLTVRSCCSYCLLVCSRSGMDIGANINQNKDIFQNCYCPVKVSVSHDAEEGKNDRDGNQDDDDPLQHLHPPAHDLIGDLLIDALECFKFAENTRVPVRQMKALGGKTVKAREILVAQQFQDIVHAFK